MPSIRTEPDSVAWTPWTEVFGDGAFYEGRPIIETKTLSDRAQRRRRHRLSAEVPPA
jgi:hypothetical protein